MTEKERCPQCGKEARWETYGPTCSCGWWADGLPLPDESEAK